MSKKNLIFLATVAIFTALAVPVIADHEGPERIVNGKYRVTLSIIQDKDQPTVFRFFFHDPKTGARISTNISGHVSIYKEEGEELILEKEPISADDGIAKVSKVIPSGGLFLIDLEFQDDSQEKTYGPIRWPVWLSGARGDGGDYPMGFSELAGFGLLGLAVAVTAWSFIYNRRASRRRDVL